MTSKLQTQTKRWADTWKQAAPELERLRDEAAKAADSTEAILILNDAFESARQHFPPRDSSGLVEQQAIFRKLRR